MRATASSASTARSAPCVSLTSASRAASPSTGGVWRAAGIGATSGSGVAIATTSAGAPVLIEELLTLLREGPPGAVVKQVITLHPPHNPELPMPFTILK